MNALYTWNFEPGKLILSGSYIWKDATYGVLFNRPYALAPSYDMANFRATFKDAKDRYDLIAYVNNVFDKQGYDRRPARCCAPPACRPPARRKRSSTT